ncbi:hypothetical protein CORT_0F02130 [Candida orthopsilosis Co 90-125]|uniref:Uncharacterized protein n=1 Tax=Candida orthopsilosis (strain 90-125) TaxID=1136231 RepID=H8X8G3_CANO9|nr:hypothetical protein CORT_0F02130 [Candida orthopsilosis Co 90-125]CCG24438.1 hypothetical protein CORT_0F02130 [Candida orthopsilosis Co 90-125]
MFVRHAKLNVSRFTRCQLSTITHTSTQSKGVNPPTTHETSAAPESETKTTKPSTPIRLSRQDVKKFYTLFKISEFSSSMTHDDRLTKSLRLWSRKSAKEHNTIHAALENIINEAVKLHNGSIEQKALEGGFSTDLSPIDNRGNDLDQAYKKPKYRYNLTSGTRRIKFAIPSTKPRRYYQYLQFQEYKKQRPQQSLDSVSKSKIIAKANQEWRHFSNFDRHVYSCDYENLLYKGLDLSQDGEEVIPVEVKEGYDGVVHKVLGEPDPRESFLERSKRIPFLKLIINETTGFVHVYGFSDFHVWNYYLGKQYAIETNGGSELISNVIGIVEDKWKLMNSSERNAVRTEYLNIFSRGQDLLDGKLTSIEAKRDVVNKPKQYQVIRIRGDSSEFNTHECKVSPSKFTITQPSKLRFIKNTFVGNIIIVGELDLLHAWNYFVYKHKQQIHDIDNEVQFHQDLMHQWNGKMDDNEKEQYLQEYKAILISGHDIYMGEKMTIETKMSKTGIKNLVVDVWGQSITQGTGRNVRLDPLPISIDLKTNKVLILSDITDVHAYNYYLAKQLTKQSSNGDYGPDYSKLPHLQQEWLAFTPDQKREYANEYLQLLNSGHDYAFGKVIPIVDKLKLPIYSNPTKLHGQGTKSAFNAESKVAPTRRKSFDEMYPQAFPYYSYARQTIDNVLDSKQIVNEWAHMSDEEKVEVQEAYEMMVDAGFEMVNGILKEVQQTN